MDLSGFVRALPGKRTYLAAAATLAVSLAGIFDTVPCERCVTIGVGLVALAQVFQRLATANQETKVGELYQGLLDLAATLDQLAGKPPATIPFKPEPSPFFGPDDDPRPAA